MICKNCGTVANGESPLPGSGAIEIVLWLFVIVPGVIYSIWRRSGRRACAACGGLDLIPLDSPAGKTLARAHGTHAALVAPKRPVGPATTLRRPLIAVAAVVVPLALLLWAAAP